MTRQMVTIRCPGQPPTTAEVRSRYGLDPDDLDESFGVVEIDPNDALYAVLVNEAAAATIRGATTGEQDQPWESRGPFANPRIAPFGPPESGDD